MIKLENRSFGLKASWLFSWVFVPTLFQEEYRYEKKFQERLTGGWQ